ncbi:hypothetical protein LV779_05470 [Streptomyces thinghirensis]|nr:hypothetical protein [Streptomyces thinghirensis]
MRPGTGGRLRRGRCRRRGRRCAGLRGRVRRVRVVDRRRERGRRSPLPPDISAVLASGVAAGGGVSSSAPLSGGANTVSGSGTERSSPASALVSVPAQGVAPGRRTRRTGRARAGATGTARPGGRPRRTAPPRVRGGRRCRRHPGLRLGKRPGRSPGPDTSTTGVTAAVVVPRRRSGMPSLSAASCNHSGGLSRNDV